MQLLRINLLILLVGAAIAQTNNAEGINNAEGNNGNTIADGEVTVGGNGTTDDDDTEIVDVNGNDNDKEDVTENGIEDGITAKDDDEVVDGGDADVEGDTEVVVDVDGELPPKEDEDVIVGGDGKEADDDIVEGEENDADDTEELPVNNDEEVEVVEEAEAETEPVVAEVIDAEEGEVAGNIAVDNTVGDADNLFQNDATEDIEIPVAQPETIPQPVPAPPVSIPVRRIINRPAALIVEEIEQEQQASEVLDESEEQAQEEDTTAETSGTVTSTAGTVPVTRANQSFNDDNAGSDSANTAPLAIGASVAAVCVCAALIAGLVVRRNKKKADVRESYSPFKKDFVINTPGSPKAPSRQSSITRSIPSVPDLPQFTISPPWNAQQSSLPRSFQFPLAPEIPTPSPNESDFPRLSKDMPLPPMTPIAEYLGMDNSSVYTAASPQSGVFFPPDFSAAPSSLATAQVATTVDMESDFNPFAPNFSSSDQDFTQSSDQHDDEEEEAEDDEIVSVYSESSYATDFRASQMESIMSASEYDVESVRNSSAHQSMYSMWGESALDVGVETVELNE
jgi:hypothetical protein